MLKELLGKSARAEVFLKRIAYSAEFIRKPVKKLYFRLNGQKQTTEPNPELYDRLFAEIETFGIRKGDILIVHSSMDGLMPAAQPAFAYLTRLLELVGEEGTLVIPAYPAVNRPDLFPQKSGEVPLYDPQTTPSWTGMIPNVFCMFPDVERSAFPHNSLAAKGKYAKEMMQDNLLATTPHGPHTAWEFCIRHHAKVLFLGVDAERSNTLMHATEDRMGDEWPIADWYDETTYRVKCADGSEVEKTVKACSPRWTKYSAAHATSHRMQTLGFLTETEVGGIPLGFIPDALTFSDQMIADVRAGKNRYVVPHRYLKKTQKQKGTK